MSRPTISVVMPNYNHSAYLPEAIEQILGQSRPPDEFLILDDASTDQSRSIIESYAKRSPSICAIYNKQNAGVLEAHRKLFLESTGDYVYAGAADDVRFPDFLNKTMEMAERSPQAGLISTQLAIGDEESREIGVIQVRRWQEPRYASPEEVLRDYLERESPMHSLCTATVYRRDALEEMGWYREELGSWGDTFSARAIALKYGMAYVPEKLAMWRRLDSGFSSKARREHEDTLQMIARTVDLMRTSPFAVLFPEAHVKRWERRARRLVVFNQWMGEGGGLEWKRPGFWLRGLLRVPKLLHGVNLLRRNPAASSSR